ncbi:DUF5988 family protein [Streptomyces sp. NPDC001177]
MTQGVSKENTGHDRVSIRPLPVTPIPEPDVPNSMRVILSGGPEWVPLPAVWEVESLEVEPKVKILCGNAYEHFEFSGSYSAREGEQMPVYRWCRRTFVAE